MLPKPVRNSSRTGNRARLVFGPGTDNLDAQEIRQSLGGLKAQPGGIVIDVGDGYVFQHQLADGGLHHGERFAR